MNIYLATSWRHPHFDHARRMLERAGHLVYNFREGGFSWESVGLDHKDQSFAHMTDILARPLCRQQFERDRLAMESCDVIVMLLPCGRSAHMELGYVLGMGLPGIIVWDDAEPDLIHGLATAIVLTIADALPILQELAAAQAREKRQKWSWRHLLSAWRACWR